MSLTSLSALASATGFYKNNPPYMDFYKVFNISPELVFDFDDEYYRTNRAKTTFESAISHNSTTAQNGTMVDSDGILKWRPHNLLTHSEDLTGAGWTDGPGVTTTNSGDYFTLTADAGSSNHWVYNGSPSGQIIVGIEAKAGTVGWLSISSAGVPSDGAYFDLTNGVKGTEKGSDTASITPLSDGWYYCEVVFASDESFATFCVHTADDQSPSWTALGTETILVRRPRCIRKGLGGMVNNPDTGNSYVPTTTAARYLPRRGHHVYNGSTFVNEGLLVESESRTNLVIGADAGTGITRTLNAATSITGEVDAIRFAKDATDPRYARLVYSGLLASASTSYTCSAYFKWDGVDVATSLEYNNLTNFDVAWVVNFNLTSSGLTLSSELNATGGVESVGNGWYRGYATFTTGAAPSSATVSTLVKVSGVSGASILFYGGQLEAGSTPSSYIPTNGATATRGAETLTVAAADLPYPTPKVIGPELVTNGTFDTDTSGWTKLGDAATTITYDSGSCLIDAATSYDGVSQVVSGLTVGKAYILRADFALGTSSACHIRAGVFPTVQQSGGGTLQSIFIASSTSLTIQAGSGNSSGTLNVDNISVREIDPLSVSIQMDGRMTYADEGNVNEVILVRWFEDSTEQILTRVRTDSTNTGSVDFVQEVNNVQYGPARIDNYSPGILVPYNIASRHGSTFVNGAVDGTALTADNTPVALPDLSATDLNLAFDYNGTIRTFRMWNKDLTDAGIEEAST